MTSTRLSVAVLSVVALSACGSASEQRPEPEAPPQLRIEDQSSLAPPPPPPPAPPADAQVVPGDPAPAPVSGPPPAPPPVVASPAPVPPVSAPSPPAAPAAPPNSTQWAYEYPSGRWVYANGYGWMWVPADAVTADSDGVPYSYLYTPTYGWTWYVSPWGPGPYRYGVWVRRPWHPVGWHGAWVAHPRVVVRLGGPGPHYGYGPGYHRAHRRW